jgi:hypothetical protein
VGSKTETTKKVRFSRKKGCDLGMGGVSPSTELRTNNGGMRLKKFKRWILALAVVFLFISNSIAAAQAYQQNTGKHWAVPYANNFSQRLIPVKKSLTQDSAILAEDIDNLSKEVLQMENFNGPISFSNWQKILRIIFGKQTSEEYSDHGKINRENAVVSIMELLVERFNLQSSELNILEVRDKFYDNSQVRKDKASLIGLAFNQGLISGYSDSSFRPKDYLKNGEALAIIDRVCSKFGLPETRWNGNIELLKIDGYIKVSGPEAVEEAFWTNDKGALLVYSTKDSNVREAAKIFVNENRSVKAFEYDSDNLSESLFNENAFREERGYLSANKIIWNKNRRYVNIKGEIKSIYIPYVNFWISKDNRMALIQDEEERTVRVYDFLTENSFVIDEYFRWADERYGRAVKWSPDSRYIISTLYKPEDDIGIEEKTRFAVFDCRSGRMVKVINDYGYYSFYPTWSADGNKIAFYRVKVDDDELKDALNNRVDYEFNLPAKEIGIYNVGTGEIKYYSHPGGIILSKYNNGIVWSPQSDRLYIEAAADRKNLLKDLAENPDLDISRVTSEIWELNLDTGQYSRVLDAQEKSINLTGESNDIYSVEQSVKSISPDGKRILYSKRPNNLTRYENTLAQLIIRNLNSGKENIISNGMVTDYWWLKDESLLFVESEPMRSRYAKITYVIRKVDRDLNIREIARFTQYPTVISISADRNYLMLHEYRGNKNVKIIDLKEW